MNNFGLMNTRIIEKQLQGMSGFAFEEHSRFLLRLIRGKKYIFTRLYKDKGIDGFIRTNGTKNKNNEHLTVIEVFSIYGKEAWTKRDERKISKDLIRALNFAEDKGYILKKWNLVVNIDLDTDFKTRMQEICNDQGIEFEEFNPTVLVSNLSGKNKIFEAACYFDAVVISDLPYSMYSYHELAKRALLDISNSQKSTTDEKFKLLKDIVSTILKFSFLDKRADIYFTRYLPIARNTRIYEDYINTYKFFDGYFLPIENDRNQKNFFEINADGHIKLRITNLYPIFILCIELQSQLEKTGNYNISEALTKCYDRTTKVLTERKAK